MIVPIEVAGASLGRVVLIYPRSRLLPPLYEIVRGTVWTTVLVLLALVPLAWAWGGRVAAPLVHLADGMSKVTTLAPEEIVLPQIRSRDEIGRLTGQFRAMLQDLREKRDVERQMVATERLAALGRLSAGVAHEINNPLGGMLTALSTYRRHGGREALSHKTVSLLERGLQQIRETVSALLVEAKLETHPLSAQDIDDVRTLVLAEVHKKHARLRWASAVTGSMALPSTQVRQVFINLLLNAIEAVDDGGVIGCDIRRQEERLRITIEDDGDPIPDEHVEHLFEINVVHIEVLPLRERHEDILWLADQFLEACNKTHPEASRVWGAAAKESLVHHPWPGNVRELKHCIERAWIMSRGPALECGDLSHGLHSVTAGRDARDSNLKTYLRGCEHEHIVGLLERNDWVIGRSAEELGISRKNLSERMRRLGIDALP